MEEKSKRTTGLEIPHIRITEEFIREQGEEFSTIMEIGTVAQRLYFNILFSTWSDKASSRSKLLLKLCINDCNFKFKSLKDNKTNRYLSFIAAFPGKETEFNVWREQMIKEYYKINDNKINLEVETKPDSKMITLFASIILTIAIGIGSYAATKVDFTQGADTTTQQQTENQ